MRFAAWLASLGLLCGCAVAGGEAPEEEPSDDGSTSETTTSSGSNTASTGGSTSASTGAGGEGGDDTSAGSGGAGGDAGGAGGAGGGGMVDDWTPLGAATLSARYAFGHAFAGGRWFVVGGGHDYAEKRSDAAVYEPATDQWSMLPSSSLAGRTNPGVVHTGSELVVWGGQGATAPLGDGAIYDEASQTWSTMTSVGAPSARVHHAIAWDAAAQEVIVWGGSLSDDGARYDIATDTWTNLPPAPIEARSSLAWGWDASSRRLYVFGGVGAGVMNYLTDGAYYDAATQMWTELPAPPMGFAGRALASSAFVGGKLVVWGGAMGFIGTANDGIVYDPSTDTWTTMAAASPIPGRQWAAVANDATRMFFIGGRTSTGVTASAAAYDVATDTWEELPSMTTRDRAGAVWTGSELIVWGGWGHVGMDIHELDDGAVLIP